MTERREFQRLKLAKPILATLDAHSALILDIGLGGAFIEHRGRANEGLRFRLGFKWQGHEIAFDALVARSSIVRQGEEGVVSHSAVQFAKPHGDAAEKLEEMMGAFVGQLLAAHRANATAESGGRGILGQLGQARRDRSPGLTAYRWDGTAWSSTPTSDPRQPLDGFTVAAYEDEEELSVLCRAYEEAGQEGRNLIRLSAELSVRSVAK